MFKSCHVVCSHDESVHWGSEWLLNFCRYKQTCDGKGSEVNWVRLESDHEVYQVSIHQTYSQIEGFLFVVFDCMQILDQLNCLLTKFLGYYRGWKPLNVDVAANCLFFTQHGEIAFLRILGSELALVRLVGDRDQRICDIKWGNRVGKSLVPPSHHNFTRFGWVIFLLEIQVDPYFFSK